MIIDKNTKAGIGILESGPIKIINKVKLHDEKENKTDLAIGKEKT